MRSDLAKQHHAAVGGLLGLAAAEAFHLAPERPELNHHGSAGELRAPWGPVTQRCLSQAEVVLSNGLPDLDLGPSEIIATAIRLAGDGAGPPLLMDPDAGVMCEAVRDALTGTLDLGIIAFSAVSSAQAAATAAKAGCFTDVLANSGKDPLAGALFGLRHGPAAIPSRLTTFLHGPAAGRTYNARQVRRLAERLLRFDPPEPPEPQRRLGPREVAPKVWVANLHAVPAFCNKHPDGAVISLCPTVGTFDDHPTRRVVHLADASNAAANPQLPAVLDEILATIDAFHREGRNVLVHCHHGASRTGLVLRALLIERDGMSFDDATTEAQVRWFKTSTWNESFNKELRRRAEA